MSTLPDPLAGVAVLIIDDDVALLRTLAQRFHLAGCRVTVARDGDEGLAKFDEARPDVVVTDILMPNREGVETILAMKARGEVRIVAISGGGLLGSAAVLDLARRLGADAVLAKPFRAQDILEAVRRVVRAC